VTLTFSLRIANVDDPYTDQSSSSKGQSVQKIRVETNGRTLPIALPAKLTRSVTSGSAPAGSPLSRGVLDAGILPGAAAPAEKQVRVLGIRHLFGLRSEMCVCRYFKTYVVYKECSYM